MAVKLLTREEIFAAQDLASEVVPVPEWGEGAGVSVRAFSVAARAAFYAPALDVNEQDRVTKIGQLFGPRLVVYSVVDETGKLIFSEADAPAIAEKAPAAIKRISDVAMRLNGLGEAEAETAKKP